MATTQVSLWSRKTDLLYFIFFLTHVPIIFLIDTVSLFPPSLRTNLSIKLREFYVDSFHDKFFEEPQPVWFTVFIWMELLYHAPLSVWAVLGLWRDDPLVPVHLLPWAVQAFVTSLTCLVDVWNWEDRTVDEKTNITMLYAPYVALGMSHVSSFSMLPCPSSFSRPLLKQGR
ncbi:hypothetical protein MAP00_001675 [Monascus purpureus]|nr:hypothetical protein MAP00_001675 [Monascus purpureus]